MNHPRRAGGHERARRRYGTTQRRSQPSRIDAWCVRDGRRLRRRDLRWRRTTCDHRNDDDGYEDRERDCAKHVPSRGASSSSLRPPRHALASLPLALRGAESPFGLTGLGDTNRVRRFARHTSREPTDQRQARGARRLGHLRLANEARDVADEACTFAFVRHVRVGTERPFTCGPCGVDGFDRELGSFARRRHERTRVYPFPRVRRVCRRPQCALSSHALPPRHSPPLSSRSALSTLPASLRPKALPAIGRRKKLEARNSATVHPRKWDRGRFSLTWRRALVRNVHLARILSKWRTRIAKPGAESQFHDAGEQPVENAQRASSVRQLRPIVTIFIPRVTWTFTSGSPFVSRSHTV
jgi:hypothetical protein